MPKEDKKKHRDKSKSEERQKKRNKKKSKDQRNKSREGKKKKSQKRNHSSSSSESSNSSQSRSREKEREKQKKKKKNKEKEQKPAVNIPFPIAQAPTIPVINPLNTIRPGSNIIIPPPIVAPQPPTSKPKTKQYHIFKLLPKLPFGCVTIGRTIFSSKLFSDGFEENLLTEMCQELQKISKLEGSKKMANIINKVKAQIGSNEIKKKQQKSDIADLRYQNQFSTLKDVHQKQMNNIRKEHLAYRAYKNL